MILLFLLYKIEILLKTCKNSWALVQKGLFFFFQGNL